MKANKSKHARPSLYGFHAVREAWLNPARAVYALYMTDQAQNGFESVLREGKRKGLKRGPPVYVNKHQLEKMLPHGAVHQGLALAVSPPEEYCVGDLLIRTRGKKRCVLLVLDQVTDPHNVGAILRSACAFGADGVIMQRKHAPDLSGVLAKAACGALEHVPVAFETNLSRALEELKEGGFFVYALDERGQRSLRDLERGTGKTVLVLGAEGTGIRRLVKEHCDELVKLPTSGPIASLNVSNAAAVALYALL